jgi:hypothetical protein
MSFRAQRGISLCADQSLRRPSLKKSIRAGFLAALGMTYLGSSSPQTSLLNSTQTAQTRRKVPQFSCGCELRVGKAYPEDVKTKEKW